MGKFVEFFGEGLRSLSTADRATVSNMAPEYGATIGYFPTDEETLKYLRQTGFSIVILIHWIIHSSSCYRSLGRKGS